MSLAAQISALATRIGTEIKLMVRKANNLSDLANRQTALNNITAVSSAANEHVLTKDGSTGNVIFKVATIPDNSVNYAKTASEFKGDLTITSNAIDWSTGMYAEITLSANQTYTFTNLEKGKTIIIRMTGAYVPTFPSACINISGGTYTGAKWNTIIMTCVNSSTPKVLLSINTEP